jgi:HEAT repeat protein
VSDLSAYLEDLTSGVDEKAEAAVADLQTQGRAALKPLSRLLKSKDADQRWWAVRVISTLPYPAAARALRRALHDPAPSVRQCAALGLRLNPSPKAIPALVRALHDPDRMLARLAGDALAALGLPALSALCKVLDESAQAPRVEAARALALMQEQAAIPALFSLLDDPSALVVYWAEHGLEQLGVGMVFFKP